jgi:hypothetical protein
MTETSRTTRSTGTEPESGLPGGERHSEGENMKKMVFLLGLALLFSLGLWEGAGGVTTSPFPAAVNLLADGVEKTVEVYFPTGVPVSGMNSRTHEEITIQGSVVTYVWHSNYGKQDDYVKTIVTTLPVVIREF